MREKTGRPILVPTFIDMNINRPYTLFLLEGLLGDLDSIADGSTYRRVASASLSAEGLILLDQVSDGTTYKLFTSTERTKLTGIQALADVTGSNQAATVAALTGHTQDSLPNGVTYGRVVLTDISAGHILLATVIEDATYKLYTSTEQTKLTGVATGADVTSANQSATTASLSGHTQDSLADGTTYKRVKSTSISSGNILLNSNTVISGEWYNESGVEIDAATGINIYGTLNALTTRATKTGTIQCYVGADGAIYAGAGAVLLDVNGLTIKGAAIVTIKNGNGTTVGGLGGSAAAGTDVTLASLTDLILSALGNVRIGGTAASKVVTVGIDYATNLMPYSDNTADLGSDAVRWAVLNTHRVDTDVRLKIPVGADMYG